MIRISLASIIANVYTWKYNSSPFFSVSFVVSMFTFTLVVVQLRSQQQPLIILFSHFRQCGVNEPFVSDLCVPSTLQGAAQLAQQLFTAILQPYLAINLGMSYIFEILVLSVINDRKKISVKNHFLVPNKQNY